jgi:hypothetical protein
LEFVKKNPDWFRNARNNTKTWRRYIKARSSTPFR